MTRQHLPAAGISLTLAAYFILSLFSALNKYVQEPDMAPQVMFFDGLVGMICMVVIAAQQKDLGGLRPRKFMQVVLMVLNVLPPS